MVAKGIEKQLYRTLWSQGQTSPTHPSAPLVASSENHAVNDTLNPPQTFFAQATELLDHLQRDSVVNDFTLLFGNLWYTTPITETLWHHSISFVNPDFSDTLCIVVDVNRTTWEWHIRYVQPRTYFIFTQDVWFKLWEHGNDISVEMSFTTADLGFQRDVGKALETSVIHGPWQLYTQWAGARPDKFGRYSVFVDDPKGIDPQQLYWFSPLRSHISRINENIDDIRKYWWQK